MRAFLIAAPGGWTVRVEPAATPDESTEVEVTFEPSPSGTLVTVVHRGWSRIRPDHPVRHGEEIPAFIRTMGMWWGDPMTSLRERAERQDPEPG